MSKYEADKDDPMAKFNRSRPKELKDLQGAKDRVKQALRKEEEDPPIPGKRRCVPKLIYSLKIHCQRKVPYLVSD